MTAFNTTDRREVPAYPIPEAAHYLGVPRSTLRAWFAGQQAFRPVIRPADPKTLVLSFSNLVEAYVLSAIRRKHHIGLPTIRRGTGIPTAVLAERFKAGDQPPDLAKDYGASEEAIWDAIRCEVELKAA